MSSAMRRRGPYQGMASWGSPPAPRRAVLMQTPLQDRQRRRNEQVHSDIPTPLSQASVDAASVFCDRKPSDLQHDGGVEETGARS